MPEREQWQLRGDAAELYERYAVPYVLGPWAPRLVELAILKPGDRVLDLACGTKAISRRSAAGSASGKCTPSKVTAPLCGS